MLEDVGRETKTGEASSPLVVAGGIGCAGLEQDGFGRNHVHSTAQAIALGMSKARHAGTPVRSLHGDAVPELVGLKAKQDVTTDEIDRSPHAMLAPHSGTASH